MSQTDDGGPTVQNYMENAAQAIRVAVEAQLDDLRKATGLEIQAVKVNLMPVEEMNGKIHLVCMGVDLVAVVGSRATD